MLRVESNTDMRGFTEYEEDILFDEDDPDFDTSMHVPVVFKVKDLNPFSEKTEKLHRYWIRQSIPEVIQDADKLYEEKKYMEVYELLNRLKFDQNAEVRWRICRALFKLSYDKNVSKVVRSGMIQEAYDVISMSVGLDNQNPNVHKWMAILTDLKHSLTGTNARAKALGTVKQHLLKAAELDPNDASVLYMLGKWCFEMSHLTWYQRKICSILYTNPPKSTYEEAYNYFLQAEGVKPRFYLPNIYMLGRTSFFMKQYYRARYYLDIAADLPPRSPYEKQCATKAKLLANELEQYDISKEALLYGLTHLESDFDTPRT